VKREGRGRGGKWKGREDEGKGRGGKRRKGRGQPHKYFELEPPLRSVCVSVCVCLLLAIVSCAKTSEPIKTPVGCGLRFSPTGLEVDPSGVTSHRQPRQCPAAHVAQNGKVTRIMY